MDAALRRALDDLQRAEQNVVLCFAEIARRRLYLNLGYATMHLYATQALGFSRSRTYRFMRLTADLERLPRLRAAVAAGEIGWTKARALVQVAGPATEEQWIEVAKRKSRRDLERQVRRAQGIRAAKRCAHARQVEITALDTEAVTRATPASAGHAAPDGQGASGKAVAARAWVPAADDGRPAPGVGSSTPGVESSTGTGASPAAVRLASSMPRAEEPGELASVGGDVVGAPKLAVEPRADEAMATVTFRLDPLQLARYEVLIERIRRLRVVSPATTREELLLLGLEGLLISRAATDAQLGAGTPKTGTPKTGGVARKPGRVPEDEVNSGSGDESRRGPEEEACRAPEGEASRGPEEEASRAPEGEASRGPEEESNCGLGIEQRQGNERLASTAGESPAENASAPGLWPRGHNVSHYRVIICKCETCQRAVVQTSRGEKEISSDQLAAIECDAVVARPGVRNAATIAPSVRAAVLVRDRHRCQAPGCVNTRFLELHHVISREKGGLNRAENLVTLCSTCHRQWHVRGLGAHFLRRRPTDGRKSG